MPERFIALSPNHAYSHGKEKPRNYIQAHVASEIEAAERRERTGGWREYQMLSVLLHFPRLSRKTTAGTEDSPS